MIVTRIAAALLVVTTTDATAQTPGAAYIQTPDEALAQDADTYAARYGIPRDDAVRRLRAEGETIAATDAIAVEFGDRLAGIAIEHDPAFRIVVLLTGPDPVPGRILPAGGMTVPVIFRTGTSATHAQLLAALGRYQATIRASLRRPPGMGIDQRTGELVIAVAGIDADREGPATLQARFAAMTGVPVRVRSVDRPAIDLAAPEPVAPDPVTPGPVTVDPVVEGGGRVIGINPDNGRRYACTTGFAVTDGVRSGIATAAHCPDMLSYIGPTGATTRPLPMVGQWGWGHQDVQVNAPATVAPFFYADTARRVARPVTGQRARLSARAGDTVCHRGERTGYSCSTIELTDFAPAGDLCGGACLPTWITVAGPTCKAGDSGAPVFLGTVALGLLKGASYRSDGSCAFWFYMSTDYLPDGWSLIRAPAVMSAARAPAADPARSGHIPPPPVPYPAGAADNWGER